jgi:hypothetical protein
MRAFFVPGNRAQKRTSRRKLRRVRGVGYRRQKPPVPGSCPFCAQDFSAVSAFATRMTPALRAQNCRRKPEASGPAEIGLDVFSSGVGI